MTARPPEAYAFHSPLDLAAMRAALTQASRWAWRMNDSDTYGDYLSVWPPSGETRLRVFRFDAGSCLLDVLYGNGAETFLSREALDSLIRDSLLPALQASSVREADSL